MSIRGLKRMALLLTFWLATQCCRLSAQTITGNVVTNNLTVTGSNVEMGTETSTTNPGWVMIYTDQVGSTTNSSVEFEGMRGNTWAWEENNSAILQMTLDTTDTVKLYNSSGTVEITLNPTGTSSFASSVVISGTNNTMTNQTLTGSGSVLTEGLADSRYVSSSATSLVIGIGASATGTNSVAIGTDVSANGNYSFAEGLYSTASGTYSTAMGASSATGTNSTAMGQSTASGNGATAFGDSGANGAHSFAAGLSVAYGLYSTAIGGGASASGYASTAIGYGTSASSYGSTAIGWLNSASGPWATAFGQNNVASGNNSTVMGAMSVASGGSSTAMGGAVTASGYGATAMGCGTTATGNTSTAAGLYSTASGYASVALGFRVNASGLFSAATGRGSTATGNSTTASGYYTTAQALDSFVIGTYNVGGGNQTSWVATDPVFEIGNGTSTNATSDALIVYKSGNVTAQGVITAPSYITTTQTGDIPMYTGN